MGRYSKIIREMKFEKIENNNCCICNKYGDISEKHHIIPVSTLSKVYDIVHDESIFYKFNKAIMLCPNHHSIYHKIMSRNNKVLGNLTVEEIEYYRILVNKNIDFHTYISKELYNNSKSAIQIEQMCQLRKEKSKLQYIKKMIDLYIE